METWVSDLKLLVQGSSGSGFKETCLLAVVVELYSVAPSLTLNPGTTNATAWVLPPYYPQPGSSASSSLSLSSLELSDTTIYEP